MLTVVFLFELGRLVSMFVASSSIVTVESKVINGPPEPKLQLRFGQIELNNMITLLLITTPRLIAYWVNFCREKKGKIHLIVTSRWALVIINLITAVVFVLHVTIRVINMVAEVRANKNVAFKVMDLLNALAKIL